MLLAAVVALAAAAGPGAGGQQVRPPLAAATSPAVPAGPAAPPSLAVPAASSRLRVPSVVRVGLATDLEAADLPCCAGGLVVEAAQGAVAASYPLRIEPAAGAVSPGFYRLQVAALKDEGQARGLARRLAGELAGQLGGGAAGGADVVFDAGSDLYRVRVGRWADRAAAEAARERLRLAGVPESWVVSEPGTLSDPALRVRQGDQVQRIPGRWLRVVAPDGGGVGFAGTRYRGQLRIHLNSRGLLNVVNELPLEEYLRGVVPREMGPEVYDSLEALKAQAVAARTFTLKNLGEFGSEGYDICASPRCQVYGGMDVEHPLTDRAVAETAGQVLLFEGELVEALYSSTCGGHTEDVEVIFPLKRAPYLRGVACLEAGVDRLAGTAVTAADFPDGLTRLLLPPVQAATPEQALGARLEQLAFLAGLPIPGDRLRSLERREVQRFIASIFDLALDARLFVASADLPYLLGPPPRGWSEGDLRLAAYLRKSGLLEGDLDQALDRREIEETLFRLALHLEVLSRVDGRYQGLAGGALRLRAGGEERVYPLASRLATFSRRGSRVGGGPLALLAGDPLTVYVAADGLLAVVHEVDADGAAFDRSSRLSSWRRYRSDAQLAELVGARYPGLGFRDLAILERGVSGRVGRIRVDGAERSVEVEGLAVRWTLDLPDTLFTAKRLQPPERQPGWLFTGRGWGHGVGLCQVGAFGMGLRGHDHRDILRHYYSGVEVVTVGASREPVVTSP